MDVRDGRQPFGAQLVEKGGTVSTGLTFAEIDTILAQGNAAPLAIGVQQRFQRAGDANQELRKRRQIVWAIPLEEYDFCRTAVIDCDRISVSPN